MTARENVELGLRMTTELANEEIDHRVTDAASLMDIEDLLEKKPGEHRSQCPPSFGLTRQRGPRKSTVYSTCYTQCLTKSPKRLIS